MNKKKWLILTSLSLLAITGSVGTAMALNHTKINVSKAEKTIYTMVVDKSNCALITPGNLSSITANGNKVKFQYPSSGADFGTMPENAFLRIKTNNSKFYVSKEAGVYHAITGIESIKVNYVRCPDYINSPNVTEGGQTGDFTLEYGYVDMSSGITQYGGEQNITNNVETDLSAISPRYFRLTKKYNPSSGYGALLLQSITIKYTCDEDRTDEDVFMDIVLSPFSKDPDVNISTNTVTYGMYPQSLASNQEDLEQEYNYGIDPISSLGNNYYFINGHLYARKLAESTGYNDEYVVGEPYWFNVEPVEWYRQKNIGKTGYTDMLLMSKKVLTSHIFGNQTAVVRYGGDSETHSVMRDYLEGEFKNQLLPSYFNNKITGTTKDSGSVVINSINKTGYDALTDCTIFPLSEAELKSTSYLGRNFVNNNSASETRKFEVTAYARSFAFTGSSLSMKDDVYYAKFWMRSSYEFNGFCTTSGQIGCNFGNNANDKYGVLPAMTIRIEN